MIRLCRVYDHGPKANGLPRVLSEIRSNLDYFDEQHFRERLSDSAHVDDLAQDPRIPDSNQLELDIKFCSEENEPIKRLLSWRNSIFAHRSLKLTIKEQQLDPSRVPTFGDISELLESGLTIINRYSYLYRSLSYSAKLPGHDDFKYVLKCLRNERLRSEEELRKEYEKYGITYPTD